MIAQGQGDARRRRSRSNPAAARPRTPGRVPGVLLRRGTMATIDARSRTCSTAMDDAALLRYSRHILLDELGPDAQARFAAARALVVGVGGLGAPAAQFLAAAGIGTAHALRRRPRRPHQPAAPDPLRTVRTSARRRSTRPRARLAAINPEVEIVALARRVDDADARAARAPTPTSCSTAPTTSRRAMRSTARASPRACRSCPAPRSASTASSRCSTRAMPRAPCYHCLFGEGDELEETRCATMGVFAPLVGIVGATQAAEALKLVAGVGHVAGRTAAAARRAGDAAGARCACRAIRSARCAAGADAARASPRRRRRCRRRALAIARASRRDAPRPMRPLSRDDWRAIQRVIGDQLDALRAGDAERAFGVRRARASARRSATPPRSWRWCAAATSALLVARYTEFLEGAVIDGLVIQPLRLVAARQHGARRALHDAARRAAAWRIAGCVIAPSTVKAA